MRRQVHTDQPDGDTGCCDARCNSPGPYTRSGRGGPRPVAGEQVIETIERTVCVRPAKEEAKDQGGGCLREERRKTQKQVVLDPLAAPTAERPRHVARQEQALYFMADGLVKSAGQVLNLQAETQNGIRSQ